MNTIGSGIYHLLDPSSSARDWIGYQIVVGVGAGIVIQIPVMVAQRVSTPQDMSMTVGIIMCKSPSLSISNRLINYNSYPIHWRRFRCLNWRGHP